METSKGFASDNYSGIHPKILEAIQRANLGHASAYGNDEYTLRAVKKFKEHFGKDVDVYFVYNGTGANVLGLKAVTESFNSIICAETAHLSVDECCAPEKFTGCKLLTVPTNDGKISVEKLKHHVYGFGDQHHAQPKVISITQPTELGTLYTLKEVKELADYAHKNNMLLHVDGARLSNAAASLNKTLKEITFDLGVDILSFGGTKNGMMFGEAIIFCNPNISKNVKYIRDQSTQLASKMRFISAQFITMLTDNLWLKNAQHANKMAQFFAKELEQIKGITLSQSVQTNSLFPCISQKYIVALQEHSLFYVWDTEKSIARFMTSWNTTEEEIMDFIEHAKKIMQ